MPIPPVDATVKELLETVRGFRDEEGSRAQSLQARAAGIAAFVSIIVPLSGLLTKPTMGASLGVRIAVAVVGAVGLALMLAGAALAVWKILLPARGVAVSMNEIKKYPTDDFVGQEVTSIRGRQLWGAVTTRDNRYSSIDARARSSCVRPDVRPRWKEGVDAHPVRRTFSR